ncbi:hypothetical protein G3T36_17450 [Diaminobutyricibacter tongyongensis]|uniref:DUF4232 domain-containing protein n=1 Tax=Leifsonia tongyongensis TaxID=1268043 RepID=A0A6L9Y2Z1_9MICO|nr:hypothetical protein [Diaminobutyricibacter tongyongensis]NEN07644.1 hypothetical protein [Diaminobutyricibacter tongyongensis]
MNDMVKKLIAMTALASSLALVGCVAATPERHHTFTTIAPVIPTPTSAADVKPAASGIVDTVWVEVYPGNTFKAKHGCHCTLPDSTEELFPTGTPVLLVTITMTGAWKPSQGNATRQDVTGTTLNGTKFDGRPERAVLDTVDGPAVAKAAGLPWLPSGLFHGEAVWTIPNKQPRAFAAAWYLPPGVDRLLLTVNVPAEGQPNRLVVPLPATAISATSADGE